MRAVMDAWRCFLDSLSSDGGHVFVLLVLIAFGAWLFSRDATAGGQIMTLSFGALLALTKATGTNREQMSKNAPPDTPPAA